MAGASADFFLALFMSLLICGALCAEPEVETGATGSRDVRFHIPKHVRAWTDKLKVQQWIDTARAEITQDGKQPLNSDCDSKFGQGYLDKWKAAKKDVCLSGGQSTFTCYEHPPHVTTGGGSQHIGSVFCAATNLILDSTDFLGAVVTSPGTRYPTPKKGSVRVNCPLANPLPWSQDALADQHSDKWLYDALSSTSADEFSSTCSDPRRTVSYPVYFVTRMDPTNAFHHFEEVNNFFMAMYLFPNKELLQQGITVVALDGAVPGFYLELWRRIAFPYRIRFLRDRPYPPGTCFKNVLLAAMPHRSLYTHAWPGVPSTCRSVVFTAVMNWARALMADTRPEWYNWPDGQHRQNGDTLVGRVTWISRRHFEAANRGSFSGWQSQRMINNEDDVMQSMIGAIREWNSRSCLRNPGASDCRQLPVYFEFGSMELGDHRWYPEQLLTLSRTNILVGVHGAGMFNLVWMQPAASAAIEIMHNSMANYHYHNIAYMLGTGYTTVSSAHDPAAVGRTLTQMMDSTAQRMVDDRSRQQEAAAAAAQSSATSTV